jgi:hypothetical protein
LCCPRFGCFACQGFDLSRIEFTIRQGSQDFDGLRIVLRLQVTDREIQPYVIGIRVGTKKHIERPCGFTEEAAEILGKAHNYIGRVETGKIDTPPLDTISTFQAWGRAGSDPKPRAFPDNVTFWPVRAHRFAGGDEDEGNELQTRVLMKSSAKSGKLSGRVKADSTYLKHVRNNPSLK